ncbi:MAG TPA: hypothetical protein VGG16_02420 [Streptosporangiaceae bacterium]|jgi:hypothetical protein
MSDENLTVPARVGDLDPEDVTLEVDLVGADAEHEIDKAVRGRHRVARKYVRWVRRQHPDATPAEVIALLEHHYVTAITAAGTAVTAVGIAAEIGISLIPGAGAAAAGGKAAAKEATKAVAKKTAKTAAKAAAPGVAKSVVQRLAARLPAGDKQLQFEITALFALAIADIHGMDLDQQQARALVYGLSNDRVSQKQIAAMASDLAQSSDSGVFIASPTNVGERKDLEHWADTLADSLPGGAAQSLVHGVQTGILERISGRIDGKQQTAVEYGAGALVDGVTRFVFGRKVISAAQTAFSDAPDTFPVHLDVPAKSEQEDNEPSKALEALEDAAKSVGAGVSTGAVAVGAGAVSAADAVSRPFRSVDLDGDGVPDAPQALTAVKGVGGAIAGVAGSVGDGVSGLFKPKRRGKHVAGGPEPEPEAGIGEHITEK